MNVVARRAALTFVICCAGPGLFATEVEVPSLVPPSSLRPFLDDGWVAVDPAKRNEPLAETLAPADLPNDSVAKPGNDSIARLLRGADVVTSKYPNPESRGGAEIVATDSAALNNLVDMLKSHQEPKGTPTAQRSEQLAAMKNVPGDTRHQFDVPTRVPVPPVDSISTSLPNNSIVTKVEPAWQELPEPSSEREELSDAIPVLLKVPPRITAVASPRKGESPETSREGESRLDRQTIDAVVSADPVQTEATRGPVDGEASQFGPSELMQLPDLASPRSEDLLPTLTSSITLHTTRLQEHSHRSLVASQQSLQRGATRTARKHALEALQQIIAMQDVQAGGNVHSQHLDRAFDAIRESNDFCGEFGYIDTSAIVRMVSVHETTVLKHEDLARYSALQATESYLDHARTQLVLAAGGKREASQALALLGQIEFQVAGESGTHAKAVAVALQRAAVESDPTFAIGYQVLGTTFWSLGLNAEAASYLIAGLRLEPTRAGYERLLDVSRRLGDADTARICIQALEDPRMDDVGLVVTMTPQQFAATHRPRPRTVEATPASAAKRPEESKQSASRTGFRLPFSLGSR